MALPQFTLGANTLVFSKGLKYPIRRPHEKVQAIDRTAAGTLQVESLGIEIKRLTLRFMNLSATDYDALLDWYQNKANGAANTFTYTDDESNAYSVVWMNNFEFNETKAGFNGTINLEIVG
jgi:hypothetical protein